MNAITKTQSKIARPLKVLVPLIQGELHAGHSAGMEHYRRAGEMLLEAKDQVSYGSWGKWINKNFDLSQSTANSYMRLARQAENGSPATKEAPQSLREFRGDTARRQEQRQATKPFYEKLSSIDQEEFSRQRQARDEELRLHRELAIELIDLGYRALAMRLHPDRGGSKEAMSRLNAVHQELKVIAENRRFV